MTLPLADDLARRRRSSCWFARAATLSPSSGWWRGARPADLPEALKARMKGVRVVVSPEAPGPMAAGLFRPCIVLPEIIALASPGMAALLEHERAHIERRDMAVALAQRVIAGPAVVEPGALLDQPPHRRRARSGVR